MLFRSERRVGERVHQPSLIRHLLSRFYRLDNGEARNARSVGRFSIGDHQHNIFVSGQRSGVPDASVDDGLADRIFLPRVLMMKKRLDQLFAKIDLDVSRKNASEGQ